MNAAEAKTLLKQFKSNDKNSIDSLYALYSRRLYKFAFAYLKTEEDALDVVQDVFISLWDKRNLLKEDTNLEAYLFTVAKNSVISIFRKKVSEKTYLEHLRQVAILHHNDSEEQFDYEILSERIQALVEQLPAQRRLIFRMSKEKGQSNKLIAEELNISVKTVEDHITKARRFIKKHLQEYGLVALLFFELFV
ncbi:MAG: RNA polymerase sigma-70 factor [Prolixibacteraceae bacterium]|jgi:RNA polymerase sigma-70 factor (ECF subfamily)|nr:RNA polymerase sigma-70 factor [Prolixibacteraceae bacterium]